MAVHHHKVNWLKYLPYDATEGPTVLQEIKDGLAAATHGQDYKAGCVVWGKRLKRFLELKHQLTVEDRAGFAKVIYELAVAEGMDSTCVEMFAKLCEVLIQNEATLPSHALSLKWRPLYDALQLATPQLQSGVSMSPGSAATASALATLAQVARRFFEPSSTQEILDELLSQMNVHSNTASLKGALNLFLPVEVPPPMLPGLDPATTPQFYWVSTLFNMWSLTRPSMDIILFVDILARLAEAQVGHPDRVKWTDGQIRDLFSAGLGNANLPVGSGVGIQGMGGQPGNMGTDMSQLLAMGGGAFGESSAIDSFGKLIVWTMYDSASVNTTFAMSDYQPPIKTMDYLAEFIQAVESYFHPSNQGRWTYMLTRLVQNLSVEFLRRLRLEADPDCQTPPALRISPAMRQRFVEILRPVCYLAMFSKNPHSVNCTHNALKQLAWIHPDSVLPGLLERIYPALETLTESHRTISCLGVLFHVALPLFHRKNYPQGARHLVPLLDLAIPGIDMNDPRKTSVTLLFIRQAAACAPLVDLTRNGYASGTPVKDFWENSIDKTPIPSVDTESAPVDMDEEDDVCRISTSAYEGWIIKFFERAFAMLENLPQQHGNIKTKNSAEQSVIAILASTCEILFAQMSPEMEAIATRKIVHLVTENITPASTKAVGLLCSIAGSPHRRLETFVPLCCDKILEELEHGAGQISTSAYSSTGHPFAFAAMSDTTLHWYQSILYKVCERPGAELLKYKDQLLHVVRQVLTDCHSRRAYKWAGRVIRSVLMNCSAIYPVESRSQGNTVWNDPDYMKFSYKYWGQCPDPDKMDVTWHVPNEAEKAFVMDVVREFVPLALENMKREVNLTGRPQRDMSVTYQKWLSLLKNCLLGMTTLVPPPTDRKTGSNEAKHGQDEDDSPFSRIMDAGYCFPDPSTPAYQTVTTLRAQIGDFLVAQLSHFRTSHEDDVQVSKQLLRCAQIYLTDRGSTTNNYEDMHDAYNQFKRIIAGGGSEVSRGYLPRYILVIKIWSVHVHRLQLNTAQQTRDALSDAIVEQVSHLCFGRYAVVRKDAQRVVKAAMMCFGHGLRKQLFRQTLIVAVSGGTKGFREPFLTSGGQDQDAAMELSSRPSENADEKEVVADRVKGALYLLKTWAFMDLSLKSMASFKQLLEAMATVYKVDKPSIKNRWSLIAKEILTRYRAISLSIPPATAATQAASALLGAKSLPAGLLTSTTTKVQSFRSHEQTAYTSILSNLIHLLNTEPVPLSYRTIIITFIELVLSDAAPVPIDVTRLAITKINSEELSIRKISLKLLSKVLVIAKRRAKKDEGVATPSNILKQKIKQEDDPHAPDFAKNVTEQSFTVIQDAETWSKTLFLDDMRVGWYSWPETCQYTQGGGGTTATWDASRPYNDPSMSESIELIAETVSSPDFWEQFFHYHSQETVSKLNPTEAAAGMGPAERFNGHNAMFYQLLFTVLPDCAGSPIKTVMERFVGEVEDKAKQRAVTEVVCGVVRGAKYFDYERTRAMWEWIRPLWVSGLATANSETLMLWSSALILTCARRDPRRVHPLIQIVLDQDFNPLSHSFFQESKKLHLVGVLISTYNWRVDASLREKLLKQYLAAFTNPYQQVRQHLGANVNMLLQIRWWVGASSIRDLVGRVDAGTAAVPISADAVGRRVLESVVGEARRLKNGGEGVDDVDYKNFGMTVIAWFASALRSAAVSGLYPYITAILPEILQMQVHGDQDLQQHAQAVAQVYASTTHPRQLIPETVDMLMQLLSAADKSSSAVTDEAPSSSLESGVPWQVRWRTLPMLQIFFFRHLFLLSPEVVNQVMEGVAGLLEDAHLEVRQLASVTLSGLIRCSQREAVEVLKERFTRELSLTHRQQRKNRDAPPTSPSNSHTVQKRHAAVLGLSALVQAFPYDLPPWMPSVLTTLAPCVEERSPIGPSVQRVFAEFRRTHQDTWAEDSRVLTEEERGMLADLLISPSYYA
ncbi:hypothetical protein DFS34DRAFT_609661 [Phlyctochytrium arcticum]|nr:hypothetical protein DFS34DRAFT_609661 [Phlyctochytrium arcticum]